MKAIKRVQITLLIMMLCFGMMTVPVFAASSTQDGLEVTLTTDKETYSQSEQIVATLTVTNTNEVTINSVSLENVIPEGYKLADGSEVRKQAESLGAGETVTLKVTYVADTTSGGSGKSESGNSTTTSGLSTVTTGDNSNIAFWIILLVLACGGIVTLLVLKKKFGKKLFSLFLCVTMVGTMVIGLSVPAEAVDFQGKSISVSEKITVGNTKLAISAIVKYGVGSDQDDEPTKPTKPENPSEADEYYWDNSEVVNVIDAQESNDVPTETEVIAILEERGFVDYPITYEYSIDGEYDEETEVLEGSTDKHPMYQTYYVAENGDVWTIFVINGAIFANPASFNLESELGAQLLFSETKELTSYDDETNKFYVTIPKESAAIVKVVEKIDAETLDKLTIEEIKNYEK